MRVAIVTIYGEFNFGNRLQNYAVQKYFENNGISAETIVACKRESILYRLKKFSKSFTKKILSLLGKRYPDQARENKFRHFTKRNIKTKYIRSANAVFTDKLSDKYDAFVVGSDQVWNPTFGNYEKMYENMFLLFTKSEKKLCFAPSIGISEIPNSWRERFIQALSTFAEISVREQSGAKLIKELTGKVATVLPDPTLTLSKEEWEAVSVIPEHKNAYLLSYFLGNTDNETKIEIDTFSLNNSLDIINILDQKSDAYISGPSEFLGLIAHSKAVFTDSFHACVFSIIFDIPFKVFQRNDANKDMYSRINTLLSMFGVEENQKDGFIVIDKETKEKVLCQGKEKVNEYFKDILKGDTKNVF